MEVVGSASSQPKCDVLQGIPPAVSAISVELSAEEQALARSLRRKRKKALKLLTAGRLTSASAVAVLNATDLAAASVDISAAFVLTAEKNGRRVDNISLADVQQLALWMFSEAASPQWISVRNRALIGTTIVLIIRGSNHAQLLAAVAAGVAPRIGALAAMPTRMPRGRHWSSERKELLDIDSSLLYVSNTSLRVRVGGTQNVATGVTSRPTDGPAAMASGGDGASVGNHGDDVEQLSRKRQRTSGANVKKIHAAEFVFDHCLRIGELAVHRYPLPTLLDAKASTTEVAAHPRCQVQLSPGFVMTRTAVFDLHSRREAVRGDAAGEVARETAPFCADAACNAALLADANTVSAETHHSMRCAVPRLVALDCEMCTTAVGTQVARVTAVDVDGAVLLDELVRPTLPVLDHLTQFSGVTARMLAGATASFEEVRSRLVDILDGTKATKDGVVSCYGPAIAVGHSLECDLQALRLVHTRIIDTSLAFPNPRGLPARHALRYLVRRELDRVIQAGHGSTGHDSVEDTRAAMELVSHVLLADVMDPDTSTNDESKAAVESVAFGGRIDREHASPAVSSLGCTHDFTDFLFLPPRAHLLPPPADSGAAPAMAANDVVAAVNDDSGGLFDEATIIIDAAGSAGKGNVCTATAEAHPHVSHHRGGSYAMSRGVGGLVSLMRNGEAAQTPSARITPPSRGLGVPLLGLAALSDRSICGGVTLLGSPMFVQSHIAGSASGVSFAASGGGAPDACKILTRVSDEARRITTGRQEGRWGGPGLVVAELALPVTNGGAGPDWATFDTLWGTWLQALPPKCAIIGVTQAAHEGSGGRGRGATVAERDVETAVWGTSLFAVS